MTQPPDEPKVITADVIEAGQIVLVDKLGKRRADISCKSEGRKTSYHIASERRRRKHSTLESFEFPMHNAQRC